MCSCKRVFLRIKHFILKLKFFTCCKLELICYKRKRSSTCCSDSEPVFIYFLTVGTTEAKRSITNNMFLIYLQTGYNNNQAPNPLRLALKYTLTGSLMPFSLLPIASPSFQPMAASIRCPTLLEEIGAELDATCLP